MIHVRLRHDESQRPVRRHLYLWLTIDDGVYVAEVEKPTHTYQYSKEPRTWFVPWSDVVTERCIVMQFGV